MELKKRKKLSFLSYTDSVHNFSFLTFKIDVLVIRGNHATFAGTIKLGNHQTITFAVDVTDNGTPGTRDTFAITASNGYSASGTLTGGNIMLH